VKTCQQKENIVLNNGSKHVIFTVSGFSQWSMRIEMLQAKLVVAAHSMSVVDVIYIHLGF
jgi:hypothetical protein